MTRWRSKFNSHLNWDLLGPPLCDEDEECKQHSCEVYEHVFQDLLLYEEDKEQLFKYNIFSEHLLFLQQRLVVILITTLLCLLGHLQQIGQITRASTTCIKFELSVSHAFLSLLLLLQAIWCLISLVQLIGTLPKTLVLPQRVRTVPGIDISILKMERNSS